MALLLLRSQKSELKLALLEPSHLPAEPKSTQSNRHELVHSDHTDSQNLPLKTQGLSAPANQDIGLPPSPPTPTLTSLSLFTFFALEKEMATHSSVLAWRIPGAMEPGGLPSMGSQRVGHD